MLLQGQHGEQKTQYNILSKSQSAFCRLFQFQVKLGIIQSYIVVSTTILWWSRVVIGDNRRLKQYHRISYIVRKKSKHFQTLILQVYYKARRPGHSFPRFSINQSCASHFLSWFQDVVSLFVLFASLVSLHVYYSSVAFAFSQSFFDLLPCNVISLQKDDLMFHHLTC